MGTPIRTTVDNPTPNPSLRYRAINELQGKTGSDEYDRIYFHLTRPRCKARVVDSVGRDSQGLYIRAYCPTEHFSVHYHEHAVVAEDWARIFTPEVLAELPPTPKTKVRGYRLTHKGNYTILERHQRNRRTGKMEIVYTVGCQTIPKRRMMDLCKAILEDGEGWDFS